MKQSPESPRVNLVDIAQALGMSKATVSMSLRNDPRCSTATRERVRKQADAMGYRPDPHLSALSAYRARLRAPTARATLGMLVNSADLKLIGKSDLVSRSLTKCAEALGYGLDTFELPTSPKEAVVLTRVLSARGITGLIVRGGFTRLRDVPLDWPRFQAVAVGGHVNRTGFPSVTTNYFQGARMMMEKLAELGYRRPLVAIKHGGNNALEGLGAIRASRELFDQFEELDFTAITPDGKLEALIRRLKPDVVAFPMAAPWALPRMHAAGWRVPDQIGFCTQVTQSNKEKISGTAPPITSIAEAALSLLHRQILHDERLPMNHAPSVQIPPDWCEGTTLRAK